MLRRRKRYFPPPPGGLEFDDILKTALKKKTFPHIFILRVPVSLWVTLNMCSLNNNVT